MVVVVVWWWWSCWCWCWWCCFCTCAFLAAVFVVAVTVARLLPVLLWLSVQQSVANHHRAGCPGWRYLFSVPLPFLATVWGLSLFILPNDADVKVKI